ncbi:MFS transporter [Acetobacterium wieringae]|uniref:Putative 3-hydroxyphenylpropionic transporter MhpT n=1 Tax=Acetobacterium wieringae TaxID=52694 RepID=A0A1F2PC78_9FIRM|nr:MFS transporter [Acetobacterium wieringae]OFV68947.1 putative 3-hydroxyphenylpropionic transporter MhpT [Acetobacterium wieringae]
MSIEMTKLSKVLFLITIMLSSVMIMGELVIVPITYNLFDAFPNDRGVVNTIVSIPMMAMIFSSLLASVLLRKISKKTLLIIGGTMFAVCSILGAAVDNVWYMLVMRIPYGIGIAFVNVAAVALIAEVYSDEKKRAAIMGYYYAFISLSGIVITLVAGSLAVSFWKNAYFTYWSVIPIVIMFVFFLPNIKPVEQEVKRVQGQKSDPLGSKFWIMIANFIVYNIVYGYAMYFISSYSIENNLGNTAFVGILSAITTLGSFILCATFGQIYKKMVKWTIIPSYALSCISMLTLYLYPSSITVIVACLIMGASYGLAISYSYAHLPLLVPQKRIDDAIGVVTASYSLGNFATSYLVTGIMLVLGTNNVTSVCIVFAGFAVIYTAIQFLVSRNEDEIAVDQAI